MSSINILAPSILNADFACLGEQVRAIEKGGADWVHLDIMDGHFVPNFTFGPVVVEGIRKASSLHLDCHLMISDPDAYIDAFAKAGASSITVHQEATVHLDSVVNRIKALGLMAGISLNPATPIETLEWVLPFTDLVLIMSVNPGFGGQKFIPYTLEKVRQLRQKVRKMGLATRIQVDGGIGPDNVKDVISAGADVIVCGSAIFGAEDITAATRKMKGAMG